MAFLLTIIFFLFSWLLGLSFLKIFKPQLEKYQEYLIAPIIGACLMILPVYMLNIVGFSINEISFQLTIIFSTFILLVYFIDKPEYIIDISKNVALILLFSLLVVGYPILIFGFDWVSFGNDDMANYSLATQRLQNYGLHAVPDLDNLMNGGDRGAYYWFMHSVMGHRVGSEILLAYTASVTGLNVHQVFMPTILYLHLCLISASAALVARGSESNRQIYLFMLLVSLSPLLMLGAVYQLIAQVGGMAILMTAIVLLVRDQSSFSLKQKVIKNIPAAILMLTFVVYYTEMIPFFGAAWLLYFFYNLKNNRSIASSMIVVAVVLILLGLIILREDLIRFVLFLWHQIGAMATTDNSEIFTEDRGYRLDEGIVVFPYYLIPSGLSNLWGLTPVASSLEEPFINISVLFGIINFFVLFRYVLPYVYKKNIIIAHSLIVMTLVFFLLFYKGHDFGLFKLAMFAQPFMLGAVAIYLADKYKVLNKYFKGYLFVNLTAILLTGLYYTNKSTGLGYGTFIEAPYGSTERINTQFKRLVGTDEFKNCSSTYISDQTNVVLAKFQALYLGNYNVFYPSRDYYGSVASVYSIFGTYDIKTFVGDIDIFGDRNTNEKQTESVVLDKSLGFELLTPEQIKGVFQHETLREKRLRLYEYYFNTEKNNFVVLPEGDRSQATLQRITNKEKSDKKNRISESDNKVKMEEKNIINTFIGRRDLSKLANDSCYIMTNKKHNTFNVSHQPYSEKYYSVIKKPINKLLFIHSDLGEHYYGPRNNVAFTQLEGDPMFAYSRVMASYGQDMLFLGINPVAKSRFVLDMTSTVVRQHDSKLPTGFVNNKRLNVVGRGSARVITEPIESFKIDDLNYYHLHFDRKGKRFKTINKGLMKLYGTHINPDFRKINAFGREVTLITEEEYNNINPPISIDSFPDDLNNPNLLYSGIYEDGWVSEHSRYRLQSTKEKNVFQLEGFVPIVEDENFETEVTIKLNGKTYSTKRLSIGYFNLAIPVNRVGTFDVDVIFDKYQIMPRPDNRPFSIKMVKVGFFKAAKTPNTIESFPDDLSNPNLLYSGIYKDGWAYKNSKIVLKSTNKKNIFRLDGFIPDVGDDDFKTSITIKFNGIEYLKKELTIGYFNLSVPVDALDEVNIDIEFSNEQALSFPDNRVSPARFIKFGFFES